MRQWHLTRFIAQYEGALVHESAEFFYLVDGNRRWMIGDANWEGDLIGGQFIDRINIIRHF